MPSRLIPGLAVSALLLSGACSSPSESPRPTAVVDDALARAGIDPRAEPEAQPEAQPEVDAAVDAEPDREPGTTTDADLAERPLQPSRTGPPTDAPTGSVNPNLPDLGAEAKAPKSASPNVDLSFQGKPLFIENDPLETSGVPICVAFIRGLSECWPKLDPELRELTGELLAEAVNLARSLKRPLVRERACEMGWELTSAFAPKCPGVFPAEKPPTARRE